MWHGYKRLQTYSRGMGFSTGMSDGYLAFLLCFPAQAVWIQVGWKLSPFQDREGRCCPVGCCGAQKLWCCCSSLPAQRLQSLEKCSAINSATLLLLQVWGAADCPACLPGTFITSVQDDVMVHGYIRLCTDQPEQSLSRLCLHPSKQLATAFCPPSVFQKLCWEPDQCTSKHLEGFYHFLLLYDH